MYYLKHEINFKRPKANIAFSNPQDPDKNILERKSILLVKVLKLDLKVLCQPTTVEPHFNEHLQDQGVLFAGVGSVRSPGFWGRA